MRKLINWFRMSSKTTQTIIDNSDTSYDVERLLLLSMEFNGLASSKNMEENFHKRIARFTDIRISHVFKILNGLINENKQLKEKLTSKNRS